MLRRVVDPHEYSVFVYNTWGLDQAVREELSKLLSQYDGVGIVSVDEPTRDSKEVYGRVAFAVRIGFAAEKYDGAQNLLVTPLGVPWNFLPRALSEKGRRGGGSSVGLPRRGQEHEQGHHGRLLPGSACKARSSSTRRAGGTLTMAFAAPEYAEGARQIASLRQVRRRTFTGSAIERGKLSSAERFPSSIPTTTASRSRRRFPLCTPDWRDAPKGTERVAVRTRNSLAQLV